MKHRYLPGLLWLLLVSTVPAKAESAFWVLGSFVERDTARKEGARLVEALGLDILLHEARVNDQVRYRLLTGAPEQAETETQRRQRLAEAGVGETWTLRFPGELPFMETIFPDLEFSDLDMPTDPQAPSDATSDVTSEDHQDITPKLRGLRIPGSPASSNADSYQGDYNPARLKKSDSFPGPVER